MWLGSCVVLLILPIVIIHQTECKKELGSKSPAIGHHWPSELSYARYTQYKTTRRPHSRTTTHKSRTTRRSYPITTTPKPHRFTTHRTTTRRPYIVTTTPKYIPHPHNSKWTTSTQRNIPSGHRNSSRTTRQPPFNPFFSSSTRPTITTQHFRTVGTGLGNGSHITRPPPFNPFFTSSTRPTITTQHFRTVGTGLGNGSHMTRPPPFNPFFSSSTRPTITTQHFRTVGTGLGNGSHLTRPPPFNPFFSTSTRPTITTQYFRTVGFGIVNGSHITRPPPVNPFFSSSTRPTITTQHFRPVGTGLGNGSHITRQPLSNPFHTATSPAPHGIGSGATSPGTTIPRRNQSSVYHPPGTTSPGFIIPRRNQSSVYHPPGGTSEFVIPRRNQSSIYHPPGNSNGHSTINQQSINNYPGYPVHQMNPVPIVNNNGYYNPGGGYNSNGHLHHDQPHRITIINNNINNQNHHVIYPSQHWNSYGPPASGVTIINNNNHNDFYEPSIPYRYSTSDTGSSTLGFFLGYRLGQLTRPSYHYHGTYFENNRYVPRYDHYVIHHYDYQRDNIPKEAEIPNNIIVNCDGDSGSICPENTVPLCTNNAAVMCVASASSTVPCEHEKDYNCVKSSVPCMNSNTRECRGKTAVNVSVPCISIAKIQGTPTVANNTLFIEKTAAIGGSSPLCVTVLAIPTVQKNATSGNTAEYISEPFHYTTNDSGSDSLGIYLGQTLERLEYPSFIYLNYDSSMKFIDTFDHYNIYHYYHGGNVLPNVTEIYPNSTITCAGDSGTICPRNSSSICFSDGGVACLTDITSTNHDNNTDIHLVSTTIPCRGSKDPACQGNVSTIPLMMPCMSIAKIYANISYLINNVTSINGTILYYKTINIIENTNVINATNITIPRQFCVAILVLPAKKTMKFIPKKRRVVGIDNRKKYSSLPKYSYDKKLTGNKTLGYFLVQRLDAMRYPSFYFLNELIQAQDGRVQLYDHLSIHHYYDGKEIIPDSMNLQSSAMLVCQGDSGIVCPTNTSVLCLKDGSIMCVTDLLLTESCSKGPYCVKSTIPCDKVDAPKCKGVSRVHVTIPCISMLTVYGDIMSIGNSIYKFDKKKAKSYVDLEPSNSSNITQTNKSQLFCVSIVLLPEERKISEGEKLVDATKSIFAKFAIKMLGIS